MAVSRSTLKQRARIRADQDRSTFADDTQYNYLVNEGVREAWYDLVMGGWPVNYTAVNKTATGAATITLGASGAVAFIRGVYYKDGTNYYELRRLNEGDRASLLSTTGAARAEAYEARIDSVVGPVIELLPVPTSGTYRIEYVPEVLELLTDADTWYGPARSDELIVLKTASKACRKEGNSQGAAELDREYVMLLEKVQNMASWFDMRNSAQIRDVTSGRGHDPFDHRVAGPDY